MKKYIIILYLLLFVFFLKSQNNDSILYEQDIILNSEKSDIYRKIARAFRKENKLDSAIFFYNKILRCNISEKEKSDIYEDIGMTYFYKNDFLNTLDNFKHSLYYAKEVGNDSLIGRRYSDIGVVYDYLGVYDKSAEYYYKALEIFESKNDFLAVSKIYNNLGIINQNRGEKREALEFYMKSLKIKNDFKVNKILISSTYVNIGSVYEDLNDIGNSLLFYKKALSIFEENHSKRNISLVLGNIASVKLSENELDSANYYTMKAIAINREINNDLGLIMNYNVKGKVFFYKNRIDSSIYYNLKALNIADSLNTLSEKTKILIDLVNSYKHKKDYKKAFFYQEQLFVAKDSLSSKDTNSKIETLKVVYETEKKDKEILTLQKDVYKNRIQFFIISIVLVLISIIIFLFFKQKLIKSKYEAGLFNQRLLRLQMNPHFIFNSLASIQSFMFEKDIKKAALYLSSFSKLTRSILNNSREEFISLSEDIETTENYLKIQKMRFEDSFDYEIITDDKIDPENVRIAPMLIQPFVENSVVHGFKDISYKGNITVKYNLKEDFIEILVEDNGKGLTEKNTVNHKSHALNITKERLKIINKNKKRLLSFSLINNTEKGVKVFFSVPYITEL